MARIIDADTHLMEPDEVYLAHLPRERRELAVRVERDELGWPWLVHRGKRLSPLDEHVPGRVDLVGESRRRRAAGEPWRPPEIPIPDPWDPGARIRTLAANGSDGAIAFPNLGLLWEQELQHDVESLCANMQAHNTWILELLPECAGRLHPVALLHLRDLDWFEREIRRIAAGGIRLAMLAAQPIDGRALAHPDFDRAWALFQDLGVCVCFHVASIEPPLHPAWYALDPQPGNKLLDMVFLYVSPAVALTSLIAHGKLEQFPRLRFAVTELSAGWVPGWLLHLDGASAFYASQTGAPLARLPLRPSEYFRRQVRVQAFALEGAARLAGLAGGNVFAWGSDYPHAEGMPRPSWEEYRRVQPCQLAAPDLDALAGGNAAFLIGDAG